MKSPYPHTKKRLADLFKPKMLQNKLCRKFLTTLTLNEVKYFSRVDNFNEFSEKNDGCFQSSTDTGLKVNNIALAYTSCRLKK